MSILDNLLAQTRANDNTWPYNHLTDVELRNKIREGLIVLLRQRFGGLDYWRLSKEWKVLTYEQVSNQLLAEIDLIIDLVLADDTPNP